MAKRKPKSNADTFRVEERAGRWYCVGPGNADLASFANQTEAEHYVNAYREVFEILSRDVGAPIRPGGGKETAERLSSARLANVGRLAADAARQFVEQHQTSPVEAAAKPHAPATETPSRSGELTKADLQAALRNKEAKKPRAPRQRSPITEKPPRASQVVRSMNRERKKRQPKAQPPGERPRVGRVPLPSTEMVHGGFVLEDASAGLTAFDLSQRLAQAPPAFPLAQQQAQAPAQAPVLPAQPPKLPAQRPPLPAQQIKPPAQAGAPPIIQVAQQPAAAQGQPPAMPQTIAPSPRQPAPIEVAQRAIPATVQPAAATPAPAAAQRPQPSPPSTKAQTIVQRLATPPHRPGARSTPATIDPTGIMRPPAPGNAILSPPQQQPSAGAKTAKMLGGPPPLPRTSAAPFQQQHIPTALSIARPMAQAVNPPAARASTAPVPTATPVQPATKGDDARPLAKEIGQAILQLFGRIAAMLMRGSHGHNQNARHGGGHHGGASAPVNVVKGVLPSEKATGGWRGHLERFRRSPAMGKIGGFVSRAMGKGGGGGMGGAIGRGMAGRAAASAGLEIAGLGARFAALAGPVGMAGGAIAGLGVAAVKGTMAMERMGGEMLENQRHLRQFSGGMANTFAMLDRQRTSLDVLRATNTAKSAHNLARSEIQLQTALAPMQTALQNIENNIMAKVLDVLTKGVNATIDIANTVLPKPLKSKK
ncbi:MAG TPA: hypothetical protein VHC22_33975 [Pirellulales bacterium]|nr:hypothetical protein [Pirellulales bacterium]